MISKNEWNLLPRVDENHIVPVLRKYPLEKVQCTPFLCHLGETEYMYM